VRFLRVKASFVLLAVCRRRVAVKWQSTESKRKKMVFILLFNEKKSSYRHLQIIQGFFVKIILREVKAMGTNNIIKQLKGLNTLWSDVADFHGFQNQWET
jgi:mannitol/fructose-specific phosphotransferase system IIA component (Ntr-type)